LKINNVPSSSVPLGPSDIRSIYSDIRTPYVSDIIYNYSDYFHSPFSHILKDVSGGWFSQNNIAPTPIITTNTAGTGRIPSQPFVGNIDINVS
jgi:hypothetical protein